MNIMLLNTWAVVDSKGGAEKVLCEWPMNLCVEITTCSLLLPIRRRECRFITYQKS